MKINVKCPKCGETDTARFAKNSNRPNGLQGYCKACKNAMNRTSAVRHCRVPSNWKYRYNLAEERYLEFLEKQRGTCAICEQPERTMRNGKLIRLAVDHDHSCCPGGRSCGKCIRGLLCRLCNRRLSYWKDSLPLLEKAVSYLKNYAASADNAADVQAQPPGML